MASHLDPQQHSSPPDAEIIRFERFQVDVRSGELRKEGRKVRLQPQPFQLLVLLLRNVGRIVSREDVRRELWTEQTFVDFDHGLAVAVNKLREAIGDSSEKPRYIETLPRRGYRFIAPVIGSSPSSGIEIAPVPERSKSLLWTHQLATGALALIVSASLIWAAWRLPSWHTDIVERKLTSNSSENSVSSAAVSPDGKYLAYVDNTGIYLKQIRTGETHSVALPANFSVRVDDWFPDGSRLLVTRTDSVGKGSLWSVSVFGGPPRPLADDGFGGSVSPDGQHIAFRRVYGSYVVSFTLGREQWVMRSNGTEQIKVATDKEDGSSLGASTWSPDGKRIAYIRTTGSDNPPNSSVEENDWHSARAETLFSDGRLTPALRWLPDSVLVYGLLEDQQDSSLWAVSLNKSGKISGSPKRLTRGQGSILHVTASVEGKIITFLKEHWSPSVYIGTLAPDGAHLLSNRRITLDENSNEPSSWTPDSKAVLFTSDRNGTSEIFKQAIDQPLAESVMSGVQDLWQPRLTPDGSEILYVSTPQPSGSETVSSVFALPVGGGTPRLVLQDINIHNVQCARLPSTVCLYGISRGDVWKAFRFDVRTGKSTDPPQIDSPCNWSLSPDGLQRAIVTAENHGVIHLRSTSTDQLRDLVVKGWNNLKAVDWSADGKSLLVSGHNGDMDSALLKIALDGRTSILLRSRNEIWAVPSPDGRFLAIGETAGTKNVWAIENFR